MVFLTVVFVEDLWELISCSSVGKKHTVTLDASWDTLPHLFTTSSFVSPFILSNPVILMTQ